VQVTLKSAGTQVRPHERVRLKKYVVTEHVTKTVPVSREEVRVEREPASPGQEAGETGPVTEGEDEIVLRREEPVVEENDERT